MNDDIIPPNSFRVRYHTLYTEIWETIRFILIALIIIAPIRLYIAQPFIVSGASMDPTFATGEYLIVDELTYHFNEPKRGDVIIFKYPRDPQKYFIKRLIGLPGETVVVDQGGKVTIKDAQNKVKLTLNEPYVKLTRADSVERTLKEGEYFMMGDNRAASFDSRVWGPITHDDIIGRAFVRLFPFTTIEYLPGVFNQ